MLLQDNGGDNLSTPKNGAYTFATSIAHGSAYDVKVFVAPGTQPFGCIVWGFQRHRPDYACQPNPSCRLWTRRLDLGWPVPM